MVRGMLETGYYHVLFELISQTKMVLGGGDSGCVHGPPLWPMLASLQWLSALVSSSLVQGSGVLFSCSGVCLGDISHKSESL